MKFSKEQALQKAKHYCAYQERCHTEVKEKLHALGVPRSEAETILASLIEEGYLDEERFAKQFAGGKFRMNHWGKRKIEAELRTRGVSPYCIRKGLAEIPEADYMATLEKLARDHLKDKHSWEARAKTTNYLLQKGYESDLIARVLAAPDPRAGRNADLS